jgi:hypothetical protein
MGSWAPKELTASQRAPTDMKRSLEERAKAIELPSSVPLKADCRPSKGRCGHAGVTGVEGNVNRVAMYLHAHEQRC